jgi:hypothetical protein
METTGINEMVWMAPYPHSDALLLAERFHRADVGHLSIRFAFNDPTTFSRLWSVTLNYQLHPDSELIENACENEKDAIHYGGK